MNNTYELSPRTYSLNLAAYIMAATDLTPIVKLDTETHTYYCQFPNCAGVKAAVIQYKSKKATINLNDFLKSLKYIRIQMHLTNEGSDSVC